jgi:hypothetical protein
VEDVKGSSYEAVVGMVAERPSGPGLQGVVIADVVLVRGAGVLGGKGVGGPGAGLRIRRVMFYSASGRQVAVDNSTGYPPP